MTVDQQPRSVEGRLNYAAPHTDDSELFRHVHSLPDGSMPTNMVYDPHTVRINDIASSGKKLKLHENGFELANLSVPEDINWQDADEVGHVQIKLQAVTSALREFTALQR